VLMGDLLTTAFDRFEISSGVTLDTNGTRLRTHNIDQASTIAGSGSALLIRPSRSAASDDFRSAIGIGAGARVELFDGALAHIQGESINYGTLRGVGTFRMADLASAFRNDGVIYGGTGDGLLVRQGSTTLNVIDLDGSNGNGELRVSQPADRLEIVASALTDDFDGDILLGGQAVLDMDLSTSWRTGPGSSIIASGNGNPFQSARIQGAPVSVAGNIVSTGYVGHLRFDVPFIGLPGMTASINEEDILTFAETASIEGGAFTLGQDASLTFMSNTTITGATFSTPSGTLADGAIFFSGPTTWTGNSTINGAARHNGTATTTGLLGTTIHATRLDMDGSSGDTHWNIRNQATINLTDLGSSANIFAGSIDIDTASFASLRLNLADPAAAWTLSGDLTFSGGTLFLNRRLLGSPVIVTGDLDVASGIADVISDLTLAGTGEIGLTLPSCLVRMQGHTAIEPGARVTGFGTLRNGPEGRMSIDAGALMSSISLENEGVLALGAASSEPEMATGSARASVASFQQIAGATWRVSVGGLVPATGHDQIAVSGQAVVGGALEVDLEGLDTGTFTPQVGDEFVILTAVGGVSGTFDAAPVTIDGDTRYEWAIEHDADQIVLHLANIVLPCIADIDGDGSLTIFDFLAFQNAFDAGDAIADFDGDGSLTIFDFLAFQNAFDAGCE
ncbi:MAG: GC-type dockerin domain-anchored protein, partial [Phycisphaerales bacterium JB064]